MYPDNKKNNIEEIQEKAKSEQNKISKTIRDIAFRNLKTKGTNLITINSAVDGIAMAFDFQNKFKNSVSFLTNDFMSFTTNWGEDKAREFLTNTDFENDFNLLEMMEYKNFIKDWKKNLGENIFDAIMPIVNQSIMITLMSFKENIVRDAQMREEQEAMMKQRDEMAKSMAQREEEIAEEKRKAQETINEQQAENLDPKKLKH